MLQIVKFPNPILRESMPEFDFDNPIMDPKELEQSMIKLMFAGDGLGLAANQAGVRTRMFVFGSDGHATGIFNPVIEEAKDFVEDLEGCLSFPGIYATIKRPNAIKVRWQNSEGGWMTSELEGQTCRVFLHEIDHLDGIVFQDRLSPLKWALAVKKSKKRKYK